MNVRLLLFGVPVVVFVLMVGAAALASWAGERRFRQLREQGILPPKGLAGLSHVQQLVDRKEGMLAIRLYQEIHGGTLADAKRAVGQLVLAKRGR